MTGVSLERLADTLYPKQEPKNSTAYGTVESINPDGSYQVKLNASATTTRCAKLCDAEVSDRVLVLIQENGHCAAIGRVGGSDDFIVAQGQANGWTWRKWSSGVAECWGEFQHTFAITSQYSYGWYTSSNYYETYPTGLFNATPTAILGWYSTSGGGVSGLEVGAGASSSQTATFYPFRVDGGATVTGYVTVSAKGRWK